MQTKTQLKDFDWKIFKYYSSQGMISLKGKIPNMSGVYIVRCTTLLNRVKGESNIIYIGQAGGGFRKGIQGIGNRLFNSGSASKNWEIKAIEKMLQNEEFSIECYFTDENENAAEIEKMLLRNYRDTHLELPPANAQLKDEKWNS